MFLEIEYSGCLNKLKGLINKYDKGFFDVFYLVGYVENFYFIIEIEFGEVEYSSVKDIVEVLLFKNF